MRLHILALGAALFAGQAHSATLTFTTHALSGQPAPGETADLRAFGAPVLSRSGADLIFSALSGVGIGDFPYRGLDLEDAPPPGVEAISGLYLSRTFGGALDPLVTIARTGDAPGGAGAPVIASIQDYDLGGGAGDIAFTASTDLPSGGASALYYRGGPTPVLVSKAGDPAIDLPGLDSLATIERFDGVRVDLTGDIYTVTRNETPSGGDPFRSTFIARDETPGTTQIISFSGGDAPAGPPETVGRVDQFDVSRGGETAFTALVDGADLTRDVIDASSFTQVTALKGGEIVDGLRVDQFIGGVVRINDTGAIAYQVRLTDPATGERTEGVVVIDANGPRIAFRGGEAIGATGFTYDLVSGLSINDEGDLLIAATYDGRSAGGSQFDTVLTLLSAGGDLSTLLITGDDIEVAPGDVRRLSRLAISHEALAGAPASRFAFVALFDDGSQGVLSAAYAFGAPATPIPLPAAGWMLLAGLGALLALKRRA